MNPLSIPPATIHLHSPQEIALAGAWTTRGIDLKQLEKSIIVTPTRGPLIIDSAQIDALDSVGAWLLQKRLYQLRADGAVIQINNLHPDFAAMLALAEQEIAEQTSAPTPFATEPSSGLASIGRKTQAFSEQGLALLSFVGETAVALAGSIAHPARFRWRPILYNIRLAGVDALPIVGLLSFLLGIVVAYQGAGQLRQYGANIFVVDLVSLSMLREFAPLITAIIIAGRSGSAYAAQIGTMAVTEEIDAMRTLGIAPLELLVLPKIIALFIAFPLLTVFADFLGVFGGMVMARAQLDVGFSEFLERFTKAVSITDYLIGICKAPAFALIIAVVGCFQGFRTTGGADNVGRQTTRSVVQATFLVIVADALFSVVFSAMGI
ncbi:MAG: ABC transporter permease [Azonexus sp.]|nr:ABC transporter permease [Azonexus sp.]